MMKTSQKNSDLSPEQIRAWLMLEGFNVYHRRTNSTFFMVVRETGRFLPAICKQVSDGEDTWEYVMSMTAEDDRLLDLGVLDDDDLVEIYCVECRAAAFGYQVEV